MVAIVWQRLCSSRCVCLLADVERQQDSGQSGMRSLSVDGKLQATRRSYVTPYCTNHKRHILPLAMIGSYGTDCEEEL